MNRFQFVADHHRYGVKRPCTMLGIARSSFSYWRATAADRAVRQTADARLAERIRAVHRESDGTYGVPRFTAELRETGERVNHKRLNHKRVARVMRNSDSPAFACARSTAPRSRTRPPRTIKIQVSLVSKTQGQGPGVEWIRFWAGQASGMVRRHEPTDAQWRVIEPLLPAGGSRPGCRSGPMPAIPTALRPAS
nr:IS3 family transposase [Streptomyces sp. TSRI0281]